ncbi:MAG: BMP family ABC transporter substrate-binding protein [Actinomycetota bacterium]|nr:BMP family ABC transporter substrate-binding protein [Actinomycetota bacterium]
MHSRNRSRLAPLLALLLPLLLLAAACGGTDDEETVDAASDADSGDDGGSEEPAEGDLVVGFIYVGPKDDFGYNQAAYEGSLAVDELDGVSVIQAENVPETSEAEAVMANMIDDGAELIFATSYGHLEFARNLAEQNPDVVFVHQGGLEGENLDNLGTYFGTVYEPVYTAGIAAGAATETDTLGFVYAFPIPQTLANINAFTLGAQSVNPDVETITISTGSWCDPGLQAEAVQSLLDQDVDVVTQHQDCTKTIIEATEAAGAYSVGYHADASELAPDGWLTGSEWDWDAIYVDIVETVQAGEFASSDYNGDFRVGLQTGDNPFIQSEFGPSVDDDTKALIEEARASFVDGGSPFAGPVNDQDGNEVYAEGEQPTYDEIEQMDFFVEGVVGTIG